MILLWEFRVRPERWSAFLAHYGPEGTWAELFRRAPGFAEMLLLEDAREPGRFAREYDELDRRCTGLSDEREIGMYSELGDPD